MLVRSGLVALALVAAVPAAHAQGETAAGAIIGGTAGAIIGGAATGRAGGAAAGAIIGGTAGAIIGNQQEQRRNTYYFWGNDGRCYLHQGNGAVSRVSRGYCQ